MLNLILNALNTFNTTNNQKILRLYCTKYTNNGGQIIWMKKDNFDCDCLTLKDNIKIEVKESGWYQTNLRLTIQKNIEEEDKLSYGFLSAIQQNYKAISVYYSNLENNSNFLNISLNDINYFEKGDVISVVTGQCNIIDIGENKQNIFTILKLF